MRGKDRGWEIQNLLVPKGTCPGCRYITSVFRIEDNKTPSRACILRIYSERGQIGIARAFNTKGIPPDCEYLDLDIIE